MSDDKRGYFGRFLRYVLTPCFYWLDLYGIDGKPSLAKLTYTAGVIVSLVGFIRFGMAQQGEIGTGFLWYVGIVLTYCLGKDAFNKLEMLILRKAGILETTLQKRASGANRQPETP